MDGRREKPIFQERCFKFFESGLWNQKRKKIGNHSGRKCIFLYILPMSYNDKKLLNSNKIVHGLGRKSGICLRVCCCFWWNNARWIKSVNCVQYMKCRKPMKKESNTNRMKLNILWFRNSYKVLLLDVKLIKEESVRSSNNYGYFLQRCKLIVDMLYSYEYPQNEIQRET